MDLPVNTFKRAIKAGKQQIGLWSSLSSNITVEVIAGSGFDWILIDTEHSPNELPMVLISFRRRSAERRIRSSARPGTIRSLSSASSMRECRAS